MAEILQNGHHERHRHGFVMLSAMVHVTRQDNIPRGAKVVLKIPAQQSWL